MLQKLGAAEEAAQQQNFLDLDFVPPTLLAEDSVNQDVIRWSLKQAQCNMGDQRKEYDKMKSSPIKLSTLGHYHQNQCARQAQRLLLKKNHIVLDDDVRYAQNDPNIYFEMKEVSVA